MNDAAQLFADGQDYPLVLRFKLLSIWLTVSGGQSWLFFRYFLKGKRCTCTVLCLTCCDVYVPPFAFYVLALLVWLFAVTEASIPYLRLLFVIYSKKMKNNVIEKKKKNHWLKLNMYLRRDFDVIHEWSCAITAGRQNIPSNQSQLSLEKKTFVAKVTDKLSDGYTIETVVDGKLLRGIVFPNRPGFNIDIPNSSR